VSADTRRRRSSLTGGVPIKPEPIDDGTGCTCSTALFLGKRRLFTDPNCPNHGEPS
jgi:hypothetical protein